MDLVRTLGEKGFFRVCVLDGRECGIPDRRMILCFAACAGSGEDPEEREAVIHPYYLLSQQCYRIAAELTKQCRESGTDLRMDNHTPLKPILGRLPFLRTGLNTLAYCEEAGSYFHIQCFVTDEELPVTDHLTGEQGLNFCDRCGACVRACPAGAISENGFSREKCAREWMLSGSVPPAETAAAMGGRLIGCDLCQACCPMNQNAPREKVVFPIRELLDGTGRQKLSDLIGRNLTGSERLLIQGCILAGNNGRTDLEELLLLLAEHPSEKVRKAARMALDRLP